MNRNSILSSLFLSLLFCVPLSAQQQEISVRTMALSSKVMPELYFNIKGEKAYSPLEWPKLQPSISVMAVYENSLPLYRMELDEKGKEVYQLAHAVKIPEGAKEIILFGWLNGDKPQFYAIGDNFLNADYDNWLLINLSKKAIEFRVGKATKPIALRTGQYKLYDIAVAENKGANVMGRATIRGEIQIFYSSYLPVKSERRTIILFTDDGDKIRTKTIIDPFNRRVKPEEAKQ